MKRMIIVLLALLAVSVVLNVCWWPGGHDVKVERTEKVDVKTEVSKDSQPEVIMEKPLEIVVVSSRRQRDVIGEEPLSVEEIGRAHV